MKDEREAADAARRLTPAQREIYEFIRERTRGPGRGPTVREVMRAFGAEPSWLLEQLAGLERAGLIGPGAWSGSHKRGGAGPGRRARR
jgi:SOS-response transcriptional repressor LexA